MFYKNLNDNNLMFFSETPNENWVLASENEIVIHQLSQEKILKTLEVKVARQYFQYANIIVDGLEFKSSYYSKLFFSSIVSRQKPVDYPIEWRLADDITWVFLNETQATALYDAMKHQESTAFHQESAFYVAIKEASSIEEVKAIDVKFV